MSLDHGIESMPSTSLDASPGTCSRCGFRAEPEAEACPRCGTTTQATAPAVATATPFGPGIHALAIYLKSFHALSYERLSGVFKDILQTNLLLVQRAVISI